VDGLLVVDKPGGMTSHDVVHRVRKATGERGIGHLGTLDPMATGVLPLMLGKFTRLAQFFNSAEKSYTGTIRFGYATDTYDADGQMVGECVEAGLTLEQVQAAAARFRGEIEQMPPAFSAKKVGGVPAYKMARAGKAVELKPVIIHISSFEIASLEGSEAAFSMSVSSGGYVRAVAHELGRDLGCGAHLGSLRRTQAGPFTLAQAHPLDELEMLEGGEEALGRLCVHPRSLLPEMPSVTGDVYSIGRLRNGGQANLPEFSSSTLVKVFASQRDLVAIAKRVAGTLFQPAVVLQGTRD
jgi:tRNA pseudouridine55 synthase